MAVCQPASMSDVPASSRASRITAPQLPQVRCCSKNLCSTQILWERACSRWRPAGRAKFCSELNQQAGRPVGRLAFAFALAFDLLAPSRGREEVLRSGQPGMDAGLAAPGHGWPMAAGPRSRTGARACRALARHRTSGARALGYLGLFQVTRRKGGTNSGRYRRNGYVHHQKNRTNKNGLLLFI